MSEMMRSCFELSRQAGMNYLSFYPVAVWAKETGLIDDTEYQKLNAWIVSIEGFRNYFFSEFDKQYPVVMI